MPRISAAERACREQFDYALSQLEMAKDLCRKRHAEHLTQDRVYANKMETTYRVLKEQERTLRHLLSEAVERGDWSMRPPHNKSLEDYIVEHNINQRPMPKVLQLKKDTVLKVEKHVSYGKPWGVDNEKELKEFIKAAVKDRTSGADYQGAIQSKREVRKVAGGSSISYKLSRGGYTSTVYVTGGNEMEGLRKALSDLRKSIGHDRNTLRLGYMKGRGCFAERVGGVYLKSGLVLKKHKANKCRTVFEAKAPKAVNKHVGVEIEFCSKLNRADLAVVLHDAGYDKYVTLKEDGSLRPSDRASFTHELCILVKESEYKEVIKNVCKLLISTGGYVNKSCGLHVHLDMRNRDPKKSFDRLLKGLNILYAMVPPRRRENKYCMRNALDMTFDRDTEGQRYWAVNPESYRRHKTIEIRLHSGTLSPRKISYWIELLLKMVDTPNDVAYKNVDRFINALKIRPELGAYIKERIDKFNEEGIEDDEEHVQRVIESRRDSENGQCGCDTCLAARSGTTADATEYSSNYDDVEFEAA